MTYDNILRLSDDPDVNDVIKFLRAREIVHFQRFGEGLRLAKEKLDEKNVYFVNPSFDRERNGRASLRTSSRCQDLCASSSASRLRFVRWSPSMWSLE